MNALKCRTLATKMLFKKYTLQHEQKLTMIIIEQCVGVLSSSARDRIST